MDNSVANPGGIAGGNGENVVIVLLVAIIRCREVHLVGQRYEESTRFIVAHRYY